MQVDLTPEINIYHDSLNNKGELTYRAKVHFVSIDFYMDFKFVLFHAHKGEYELYPGSYLEKSSGRWKDKFEYGKQSAFYRFLLDEIIDAVEVYSGEIINRTPRDKLND